MEESVKTGDETVKDERQADAGLGICISRAFSLPEKDWSLYSPLTLAYIGDCVYDLVIRTVLVKQSNRPTDTLHRETVSMVRAVAQSEAAARLQEAFTPQEMAIYRRGKNAKPRTMSKHASRREYLQATGLEAVLGFLYLDGQYERLVELIRMAVGYNGENLYGKKQSRQA